MASCTPLTVTVKDVAKAVKKVRDKIKEIDGAVFNGDEKGGNYKFSDDGFISGKYTIAGSYTVEGNDVTVSNNITADRPTIVTCAEVGKRLTKWLTE